MLFAGFAIVKLATDRKTQDQYAVKIMTLPPVGVEPGDNESTRCVLACSSACRTSRLLTACKRRMAALALQHAGD